MARPEAICSWHANSPSNFASSDSDRVMCSSPPAEISAYSSASRAP
jgi:hypothetical protein